MLIAHAATQLEWTATRFSSTQYPKGLQPYLSKNPDRRSQCREVSPASGPGKTAATAGAARAVVSGVVGARGVAPAGLVVGVAVWVVECVSTAGADGREPPTWIPMNMVDAINIIAKMAGTTVARRNIGGFVAAAGAERVASL